MWMSQDKRRLLAKETAQLPYLTGTYKEEAEVATQIRNEILEVVFDKFIMPDEYRTDVTTMSRWKRAKQLWKTLITENRGSYFIDLGASEYIEWVRTGEPTVLPCSTYEIEDRNKALPKLQGSRSDVNLAKEIRATLLKFIEVFEQRLLEDKVPADKRYKFDDFCGIVRKSTSADWFIRKQPKKFPDYDNLLSNLVEK